MITQRVFIGDEPYTVAAHPKSGGVWIAVGEYIGERIEVKGRSGPSAIDQWRETVHFRTLTSKRYLY